MRRSRRLHLRDRRYVFAFDGAPSDAGDGGARGWNWLACRLVVIWAIRAGKCGREYARVLPRVTFKAAAAENGADSVLLAHCRHIESGRSIPLQMFPL